ncbi:MAG: hypothetical protein ACL93V_14185 [Candidatus Electrothrix sp. YB6]
MPLVPLHLHHPTVTVNLSFLGLGMGRNQELYCKGSVRVAGAGEAPRKKRQKKDWL